MKEFEVFVEIATLIRVTTEAENAEDAEKQIQEIIDEGTFDRMFESDIGEQTYYGGYYHHVCNDLTKEVEA